MILESRSIIFSDEELITALVPLLQKRGVDGDVEIAEVEAQHDNFGKVRVGLVPNGGGTTIFFSEQEIGAAILNHCIEKSIPMPRGAYKEVALRGDHIALIIRLESGSVDS